MHRIVLVGAASVLALIVGACGSADEATPNQVVANDANPTMMGEQAGSTAPAETGSPPDAGPVATGEPPPAAPATPVRKPPPERDPEPESEPAPEPAPDPHAGHDMNNMQ